MHAPAGDRWYSGSVGRVLHREYPAEFDIRTVERRVRPADPADADSVPLFRRMLRCHCGGMLTPVRNTPTSYAYRCNTGYVEPTSGLGPGNRTIRAGHPNRITVTERVVRDWAEDESAKWDRLVIEVRHGDPRASLALAEHVRIEAAFTMGALNEDELAAEVAEVDGLLARIADQAEAQRFLRNRRGVNWAGSPASIAADIRRLWTAIHLGDDMRPVRADWRVRPPVSDDTGEALDA